MLGTPFASSTATRASLARVRALTFLVDRFAWTPFSKTLDDAPDAVEGEVAAAVVAFLHVEAADVGQERGTKVFRKTLKHLKWLANKQSLETIVLHSFTHLGAKNAPAAEAEAFFAALAERLRTTGYVVHITPFGWFCRWSIDVRGESLAKVFRHIQ